MPRRLALLGLVLLAACGGSETETARTYFRDVKPLLDAKCGACHSPGGIGPFALRSYAEAYSERHAIQAAVVDRIMPPWHASADCAEYRAERSLTDEQIATIADWVEQGAPEGDAADEPGPLQVEPSGLSRVDRVFAMPEAYTPRRSPDDYRCFLLDWPETADRYVTGFNILPGNPETVHHVIAFIAPPETLEEYTALDAAEAGPGWTCFGGPGLADQSQARWMAAWAPGGGGGDFPEDTGVRVAAGSKIVLQVHYNTEHADAAPGPDHTAVEVRLADSVRKPALIQPFANPAWLRSGGMRIPARQDEVRHTFTASIPLAVDVHAAGLHMHTLGAEAKLEIRRRNGGTDCLLEIPRWDFHWQQMYVLREPKRLQIGDSLSLECRWNNTTERDVYWGEGTSDEMCLGVLYLTSP